MVPDSGSNTEDDLLEENEIVKKIVKDPGQPTNVACLGPGYIGKSQYPNMVRLWLNLTFNEYLDIPKEAIIEVVPPSKEAGELGRTHIFVHGDTQITHGILQANTVQARLFEGMISRAYARPSVHYGLLRKAFQGGGGLGELSSLGLSCQSAAGTGCDTVSQCYTYPGSGCYTQPGSGCGGGGGGW